MEVNLYRVRNFHKNESQKKKKKKSLDKRETNNHLRSSRRNHSSQIYNKNNKIMQNIYIIPR